MGSPVFVSLRSYSFTGRGSGDHRVKAGKEPSPPRNKIRAQGSGEMQHCCLGEKLLDKVESGNSLIFACLVEGVKRKATYFQAVAVHERGLLD